MTVPATDTPHALERDGCVVTCDRSLLDLDAIHRFLRSDAYWSPGVPREVVERSIENSIPFCALRDGAFAGFARVVTDRATFAWVADVFVLPEHRGRGISRLLMEAMLSHPELGGLRRWLLATADAHGLYERFGFASLEGDGRFMTRESELARRACMGGGAGRA